MSAAGAVVTPHVRRIVGPTIALQSGEYFDFLDPENSIFTIDDIAHGLSMTCRFVGQCHYFYSVAEHCVHASRQVAPEHALAALLHDAAEAFIGDVSRPLKDLLGDYRAIEHRVETAVLARFGLFLPLPPEIKQIDLRMLATEQRQLMRNRHNWETTGGAAPLDLHLPCWTPNMAKAMFQLRFKEITRGLRP